jgi:hypothetical protein
MRMVSQSTRNAVWQSYLDVARLGRYYEALADRYQWYYRSVRFLLLFAVIVTVAIPSYLSQPSSLIFGAVAVLLTAILVAVDYVGDFAKKSAVLHGISVQVNRLESDWEMLWLEIDDADTEDSEVRKKNRDCQRILMEVTERAGEEGITIDDKLNQRCMETAYAIMGDRYRYAHEE